MDDRHASESSYAGTWLRIAAFIIDGFVLGLGGLVTLLTVISSPTKQRMGDRAAGTIVIMVR